MDVRRPLFVCACLALVFTASSSDWPHFRGPRHDGTAAVGALGGDPIGLAVDWRRPLGSGYSAVSVYGDVAVTMFAEGGDDWVGAFDVATGEERWRYRIASTYEGHSGSSDGPISTPAIAEGRVYGLGPKGDLVALRLDDGGELWRRKLDDAWAPFYGFATSPLVAGDVVVVQTGGDDGRSISAFDAATGEPRWSLGDDSVTYQSPTLVELLGRRQLVAINNKEILGVDPARGEVLWRHEHGTAALEGIALPIALGGDRLLVHSLGPLVAFGLRRGDGVVEVEELWRTPALLGAYSVPVVHEGFVYGFSRHFLTAVDAATGEVAWKSRPPGGRGGLILVDGRLVIAGKDGDVVVAEASPEGYRELARLPLFADASYTAPSFAAGAIFVRDLGELARLRVTSEATAVAAVEERRLLGAFGDFVRRVEAAPEGERQAMAEAYLADHEELPVVEDGGIVHFLYRGEASDVALAGNFMAIDGDAGMHRVAGTDLWFRSYELDPEAVWEYRFALDFGPPIPDPGNPHKMPSLFGPGSELRMPEWQVPEHLAEPEGEGGRLDSFQFRSELAENERRVRLYLPPGYAAENERRYPLLVVTYGDAAVEAARMERSLDNLVAAGRVAPLVVAFVDQSDVEEYYNVEKAKLWVRFLAEELVPHLERHYRLRGEPASRALFGVVDSAAASLYAALARPEVFGKVATQSLMLVPPFDQEVSSLAAGERPEPLVAWIGWSRHDIAFGDSIDAAANSREVADQLEQSGHTVHRLEVAGAWGWSSWRAQLDDVLETFFPAPPSEEP